MPICACRRTRIRPVHSFSHTLQVLPPSGFLRRGAGPPLCCSPATGQSRLGNSLAHETSVASSRVRSDRQHSSRFAVVSVATEFTPLAPSLVECIGRTVRHRVADENNVDRPPSGGPLGMLVHVRPWFHGMVRYGGRENRQLEPNPFDDFGYASQHNRERQFRLRGLWVSFTVTPSEIMGSSPATLFNRGRPRLGSTVAPGSWTNRPRAA